MECLEYIKSKKLLYRHLLSFIENNDDENSELDNLISIIEKICQEREELILLLRLIINIFNEHHRQKCFLSKIDKIVQVISGYITQTISNLDLFKLCESNKLFLLYFIDHQIITINDKITNFILNFNYKNHSKYSHFFYPEIEKFLNKKTKESIKKELITNNPNIFTDFDIKRREGENDSKICSIIRKDSVDEFISYVNQTNLSLSTKVEFSVFETNSFLIKENASLIEYAAFFGSLKIIQYLMQNNIELTSSLWLYAIHGRNLELIQLLERNHIEPPNNSYEKCFAESIKCHHNEIAEYIKKTYLNSCQNETNKIIYKSIFKSYNFEYFPDDFNSANNDMTFFYLCKYEYFKLVDIYLKPKREAININQLILNKYFFFRNKIP